MDASRSLRLLRQLGIHRSTCYHWLQRYHEHGVDGLEDRKPTPKIAWNQVPQTHLDVMIELVLENPGLSSREIAVKYTDEQTYFISELTECRLL